MINRVYPLRKCDKMKKELCLYYHINECLGYCCKEVDLELVKTMKNEITSFLKGDSSILTKKLEEEMTKASLVMNYERAKEFRDMLDDVNTTLKRQKLDLNKGLNFDLVNYYYDNNYISIELFFIRDGLLFGRDNEIIQMIDSSSDVTEYLIKFYENSILPKELLIPEELDEELLSNYFSIKVSKPMRGKLKSLMDLAKENAREQMELKEETLKRDDDERLACVEELREVLKIPKASRIESFDNSHLFGTFYVGGMVVFDDFLPNKDLYRKYKISTDVKDDLGAMREVLYRRYFRVLMDNLTPPDLIVMDGGQLQISVCKEIISSLGLNIPIIGLVKDDKHRTNHIMDENYNIVDVKSDSKLFMFLTRIQDEVHRYAITYHRNIKSKGALSSMLDIVPGIGEVRKKELLKRFGSLKKMKEANIEELSEVVGKDVAAKLLSYLKEM